MVIRPHIRFCLLALWVVILNGVQASPMVGNPLPRMVEIDSSAVFMDSLRANFGSNKVIPPELEFQCLIALSRYPEFRETRIEFVKRKINSTMQARPRSDFMLRQADKSVYRVIINMDPMNSGILLQNFSVNAQIGVIGHELAHLLYYSEHSKAHILRSGLRYSNLRFRRGFERATDSVAVLRGFGWQLHEFSSAIQQSSDVSQEYKDYKLRIYMKPDEILGMIRENYSETEEGAEFPISR